MDKTRVRTECYGLRESLRPCFRVGNRQPLKDGVGQMQQTKINIPFARKERMSAGILVRQAADGAALAVLPIAVRLD
jgi:hypothetical protein